MGTRRNAVGTQSECGGNAVIPSTEYGASIMGVSLEEVWRMYEV